MSASLALLCLAVVLGVIAGSYTYRTSVRNLYASVDCIDADITATVRFVMGVGAVACFIAAARGFL